MRSAQNNSVDRSDCAIVLDTNDGAHKQVANNVTADLSVIAPEGHSTSQNENGNESDSEHSAEYLTRDYNLHDYINILYFNACSILPKLDEQSALCKANSYDVVCVVESWLDSEISDSEVNSLPTIRNSLRKQNPVLKYNP